MAAPWVLWLLACGPSRPPPPAHLAAAMDGGEATELAAVDRLLSGVGIAMEDVPLDGTGPGPWARVASGHRLTSLALPRAPTDLTPLGDLPRLERLDLGEVGHIPPFPAGCPLRELRLAGLAADADLAPLAACDQLEALYLHGDLTSLETLPALAGLQHLVVVGTPLRDLRGVGHRPSLVRLHVEGGALDATDGLEDLPALRELALPHQPFVAAPRLPHLPALEALDLSHCPIVDIGALQPLVGRIGSIDLSHTALTEPPDWLVDADGINLSGTPVLEDGTLWDAKMERLADERKAAYAKALAEWDRPRVPALPSGSLSKRSATGSCESSGASLTCRGAIQRLSGSGLVQLRTVDPADASPNGSRERNPHPVRLTVSVDSGRLRVFLRPDERGAPYVDVGNEGEAVMRGHLVQHTIHQGFFVQTLDGPVTGLTYDVEPIP